MAIQQQILICVVLATVGLLAFPGAMGFRLRMARLKFAELVLFVAMAAICIIGYGSKFSPTNDPPDRTMGLWNYGNVEISNAESTIAIRQPSSNSALGNGCFHNSTFPQSRGFSPSASLTPSAYDAGVVLAEARYGEHHDFSPVEGAEICGDWRAFGAACDWFKTDMGGFSFPLGTNIISMLMVYSFGEARAAPRDFSRRIAPFRAPLEIAPESNWPQLNNSPSIFWQQATPTNTYLMTWQNVSLDGSPEHLVSFQAELYADGCVEFRYDLALAGCDVVTNAEAALLSGSGGFSTNGIPAGLTTLRFQRLDPAGASDPDPDGDGISTDDEVFVYHTNPYCADTDYDGLSDYEEIFVYNTDPRDPHSLGSVYCDGLALKLGELDPFSFPGGSTNTVLEHIFYSGTTNGAFAYPQSTENVAVLHVMVSGAGVGEMIVGDEVVPLVAPPPTRSGTVTNILLKTIGKGVRKEVWFRKPEGLDVAIDAADMLIGEMPTLYWAHGWLAFPHTEATVPCIHDLHAKKKQLTLLHGEEFPGLTATWTNAASAVVIDAEPPVSALSTANFSPTETREISYTVGHPKKLTSPPATFAQTLRFCPQLAEEDTPVSGPDEEDDDDPYSGCQCDYTGMCHCGGEWCFCECWGCQCNVGKDPSLGEDREEDAQAYSNIVSGAFTALPNTLYLYRANEKAVHLDVPGGTPRHCCPCPDHWGTNHVGLAYCTGRTAVTCQDGERFSVSYNPCDVSISGVSPSRGFGDAPVLFATNGVAYKQFDCTVLGMEIARPFGDVPLSRYNQLSPSLGFPFEVCTNLQEAVTLVLKTDVALTNEDGIVRIALEGAQGDIAVWLPVWCDNRGVWHDPELLLKSGEAEVRHFTIGKWRDIMRRYGYTRRLEVNVTASQPGSCRLRLEYAVSDGTRYVHDFSEQRLTAVRNAILPDYDWNGRIDGEDALVRLRSKWHYFWTNRDTWRDDDAFSQYSEGHHPWPMTLPNNGDDSVVNGRNDLVNLCPLMINLSDLVSAWGTDAVEYEFLTSWSGQVRFVPIRTAWENVGEIVHKDQKTLSNDDLHSAQLLTTSFVDGEETGYVLPYEFLALGAIKSGVVAVEFISPIAAAPYVRVRDKSDGKVLFMSYALVRALDVHDMYRWLNLGYVCGAETDPKYATRTEVQWPDSDHADANVVFVHGYNMHPSEAWDWSQAMFKRLRWSGMDAGFTAVLWRGNESQLWVPKVLLVTESNGYATRNYHQNVLNAFRTANAFSSSVNGLPGSKKYMIAHSLGNMLVSAARQDYGLQYDKYFMLNAAVPVEAYDPVDGVTTNSYHDMTPAEWRPYEDRVRSTHWYELFHSNPNDERGKLTWKGRFKDVDNTINFYSSKDEVVANGSDAVDELLSRDFAWYNQEQAKGSLLVSFNPQAGWKFSDCYFEEEFLGYENGEPQYRHRRYTPGEATLIANTNLMVAPFFKDFRDGQIYGDGGSAFLQANDMVRWYALSHGIPAESYAAGANPVPKWGEPVTGNILNQQDYGKGLIRNVNMARNCVPDHNEGEVNENEKELPWVHSYFIQNSLFNTSVLYEALAEQIGSTKPKEVK